MTLWSKPYFSGELIIKNQKTINIVGVFASYICKNQEQIHRTTKPQEQL